MLVKHIYKILQIQTWRQACGWAAVPPSVGPTWPSGRGQTQNSTPLPTSTVCYVSVTSLWMCVCLCVRQKCVFVSVFLCLLLWSDTIVFSMNYRCVRVCVRLHLLWLASLTVEAPLWGGKSSSLKSQIKPNSLMSEENLTLTKSLDTFVWNESISFLIFWSRSCAVVRMLSYKYFGQHWGDDYLMNRRTRRNLFLTERSYLNNSNGTKRQIWTKPDTSRLESLFTFYSVMILPR